MNTLIRLKLVLLIFVTAFWLSSVAQLRVDAGNDVIVCASYSEEYKDIKLGGCPAASGGVEPYSYTWSGKLNVYPKANIWVFASDVLEDTTKSNPALRSNPTENWMILYLTVTDAENNVGIDSVKIRGSYYTINLVDARNVTIKRGDSVALHGNWYFDSNFYPFDYFITPSYGLSDSTVLSGWAKPDTSMLYYLYVVNSVGCVSEKVRYLRVDVDTTINSVQNISAINKLQFFPNPAKTQINIYNPSNIKIKKIELIDFAGRVVQMWNETECTGNTLNIQHISPGIYLLKAETDAGIKTEKLVVQ